MLATTKLAAFRDALVTTGIASEATAAKVTGLTAKLGVLGAAMVATTAAGNTMEGVWLNSKGANDDATRSLDAYIKGGTTAAGVSELMAQEFTGLGNAVNNVLNPSLWHTSGAAISEWFTGFGIVGSSATDDSLAFFRQVDTSLTNFVQNGRAKEAAKIFGDIANEAARQGYSWDEVRQILPQYSAAVDQAAKAQTGLVNIGPGSVKAWDAQQDAATLAAAATRAAKTNLESYVQELKGLNSPALDAREAMMAWEESIDQAAESLKRNGKNIDATTDKGRDNTRALDGMARAAIANITAMQQNGAGQQALQGQLQVSRDALIKTAKQFGLSEPAAKQYADQVLRIPPAVTTTAKLDTSEALAAVARTTNSPADRRAGMLSDVLVPGPDTNPPPAYPRIRSMLAACCAVTCAR